MTVAGLAATGGGRGASAAPTANLGAIAAGNGYLFGAAAAEVIDKDPAYRQLFATQTRLITTDVALKMARVAPQPGPKHFEWADRMLAFCDQNKIAMRGHCLIWNEWVPPWIKSMSVEERRSFFDSYIDEVVARYVGRLQSWDVVNEPFWPGHRAPGGFRVGPWYDAFGTDYIARAFKRAAQVDSKAKLVLNEAQTERDDAVGLAVRSGLLKLVADLKHAGVKLDVVGLQGHLQPQYPHDPGRFDEFLHQLADLGVDIYITEFDVYDGTFPDDVAARDAAVAKTAQEFLLPTLRHPAVKALICWELADNYSFYRGMSKYRNTRPARPLPYDEHLQPKPLWNVIAQSFENARRPALSTTNGRAH
ncbi:endo-1,4-beta-xylanase [Bradyrhizobium sp. ARR65]|uniref:endo-1,4-beta-xylanase n=1 Tax=Bradyrhizobium sp. ARR65 TaxID=1040989 RepID=UPI001FD88F19|nr:endo-1,4-beta-xylanase [Bradyrhizobium sp. ARR65]